MIFDKVIKTGYFIKRINRFEADVYIDNKIERVHVPNTGRCKELFLENSRVLLRYEDNPKRKTKYDLISVYKKDKLINIDSQLPNKIVEEALKNKKIEPLLTYNTILREKTFGNSRFDFKLLDNDNNEYYLEVKGATLEVEGISIFPDAPTLRGTKHLLELIDVIESGKKAGILFVVPMDYVYEFRPYYDMDKKFCEALEKAYSKGVEVFAYNCNVGENYVTLKDKIKVTI